jgi:hypothetical protein
MSSQLAERLRAADPVPADVPSARPGRGFPRSSARQSARLRWCLGWPTTQAQAQSRRCCLGLPVASTRARRAELERQAAKLLAGELWRSLEVWVEIMRNTEAPAAARLQAADRIDERILGEGHWVSERLGYQVARVVMLSLL